MAAIGHGIDQGRIHKGLITLNIEHPAGARVCNINVSQELGQSQGQPFATARAMAGRHHHRNRFWQGPLADQIAQFIAVGAHDYRGRALSREAAFQYSLQ